MPRVEHAQFNVRSAFVRKRVHELAKLTGMPATQIVEDALRGYVPAATALKVGRLVQRGPVLVYPAAGSKISLEEASAALDAVREGDA
jgi:hypothetical protein